MSYCRFSSNDFQCDVYVYADVTGGFTTHVAGNRVVFGRELPEVVALNGEADAVRWYARHKQVMEMIDESKRESIDLPHAGGTFNDHDANECANRLESLRELGYRVPQYAIDALRQEGLEEALEDTHGKSAQSWSSRNKPTFGAHFSAEDPSAFGSDTGNDNLTGSSNR